MRKFIASFQILAILFTLIPVEASASPGTRVYADSYEGQDNLLKNPAFLASSITQFWTLGTGVTAAADTTTKLGNDPQSLKLTLSSASGDLLKQDAPSSGSISGVKLEGGFWINTSVSGLQVCPRSSATTITSGTSCTNVQANGVWQYWPANSLGGTGSTGVSLYAASAVSGTVNVAHSYVGIARNYSQVSQAQAWGSLTLAGTAAGSNACTFIETSSSNESTFNALGNGASCNAWTASGNLTAPATNVFSIPLGNVSPGTYRIRIHAMMFNIGTGSQECNGELTDGTTTVAMGGNGINAQGATNEWDGSFTYTSASSPTITAKFSGSGTNTCGFYANVVGRNIQIDVDYYPSQASIAVQAGQQWQPTVTKLLSGSGTYTVPTGVSRIEVEMVGGGGGGAGGGAGTAGGAGGNTTFGTSLLAANGGSGGAPNAGAGGAGGTASLGTGPIGIALTGASGQNGNGVGPGPGGNGGASPYGGNGWGGFAAAGSAATANTGSGGGGGGTTTGANPSAGGGSGGYIKAVIQFPQASYSYSVGAGGTAGTAGTSGFAGAAGGSGQIIITEYYYAANAPQFPGQVSSKTNGQLYHEFGYVGGNAPCTTATCTSVSSLGIATITRSGVGTYAVNFASSTFSSAPGCTVSSQGWGAANGKCNVSGLATTSSQSVYCTNNSAAAQDDAFTVLCTGPR